ncbi:dual specificity mitogen-activated protein kinase kinase 6-like [Halichondria panicea]|uniref:dual specificity mitogen-activated protein kinase kinase 6-like n=1 Tax=Halichondria panicea TaxID=6063 RepID=UPI00312B48DE
MMAQRAPPGKMDLGGGGGGSKRKKQPPRLPVGKTPVTPVTPLVTTPLTTPTPTPTSQSHKVIPDIPATIKLEELTIQEEKYSFKAEDLEDQGHLGDGAFGTVTKMLYPPTQTTMAVKKIPMRDLHATEKSGIVELAMIMKHGACPFIVEFYGCLIRDGDVWICMELLDASMDKISKRVDVLKQSIPEEIIGKMTVAVIKALHYLKEELLIIHRDVKPSNILVSRKCEFKLCDFGISGRLVDSLAKTMEVGCRPYMAPERIDPKKAEHGYTIQSDVWSFGITLLELALGKFPYSKWATIFEQLNAVVNGPPPKLPSDGQYSADLLEFSAACLRKDHLQRPDYKQLQELEFFKKYSTANVDTLTWYNSIRES